MGLATLLSIGNKADLDETDFLAAFADDDKTKVIVGYLESIGSGDEFIRVAESVAAVKPVVILKAGTTSAGSKAASSHTGALAGADIAYGAAFKRAGVIRADTFEALFDFATALAMQPLPKGDRVAIITNAGGPGIMAADAVEHCRHEGRLAAPRHRRRPAREAAGGRQRGQPHRRAGRRRPRALRHGRGGRPGRPVRGRRHRHPHAAGHDPAGRDRPGHRRQGQRARSRCWPAFMGGDGRHARPRRAGGRQPARLPLAGARRGRPQGHGRLRGLAPAPAAHRHPLPGQPAPGGAHHLPAAAHRPRSTWARPRPRTSCAPTTSWCPTAVW